MSLNVKNEIAYLGPEGSYCEAAKEVFCNTLNLKECKQKFFYTIKNVIDYADLNKNAIGIIPVENSIEGIVRESIDNLVKIEDTNLKITAETVLPINHCLVSKHPDLKRIKKIISHPQALSQCQNTIHKLFNSEFEFIETSSTSKAIHDLMNRDETYAAIGSESGAEKLGLNILRKNINDEKDNKTRFILISRTPTQITGNDKTSIVFATNNEAGALVKVLKVFDELKINLCYIDSRPSKKFLGEYVFFVDFEGHPLEPSGTEALKRIEPYTNFLKILGAYPKYKPEY